MPKLAVLALLFLGLAACGAGTAPLPGVDKANGRGGPLMTQPGFSVAGAGAKAD